MVFYRKYRPQKLSELVGQEEVSKTLLAQLESGNISHGYLFWGTRGTGKTSTARIFAKAVNCELYRVNKKGRFGEPCGKCESCKSITNGSNLDLIEIDAASNRGIDEIRDLREKVKLSPVSSPFKVYIIDEAHMLTSEAFNALLKTLEEPPTHVIFILATTEYSKLPVTIVSRLQKFNFKRAKLADIKAAIMQIAKAEKINFKQGVADSIAEASDGSYRDAISILDQVSSAAGEINGDDIKKVIKVSGWNFLLLMAETLLEGRLKDAVLEVEKMTSEGIDFSLFARQFVLFLEKILYASIGVDVASFDLSDDQLAKINGIAEKFPASKIQNLIRLILVAESEIKIYPLPHMPIVLAMCKFIPEESVVGAPKAEDLNRPPAVKKTLDLPDIKIEIEDSKAGGGLVRSEQADREKKAKGQNVSLSEVEKNWNEFLNRVKVVNAHVVALLRATKPLEFDGEVIVLEVFYRFHKDKLEEPKILKILDSKMEEVLGKNVRLKFQLASREAKPTLQVRRSDVVDLAGDELEKIAQEIFSK